MKTHTRTKEINAMMREVRKEFDEKCVICDSTESVCAHILPRGSHKEFAALREVMVVLCTTGNNHDATMEALPPRERLGWLIKQVLEHNYRLGNAIGARLVTLTESYTRLRGGILTIE